MFCAKIFCVCDSWRIKKDNFLLLKVFCCLFFPCSNPGSLFFFQPTDPDFLVMSGTTKYRQWIFMACFGVWHSICKLISWKSLGYKLRILTKKLLKTPKIENIVSFKICQKKNCGPTLGSWSEKQLFFRSAIFLYFLGKKHLFSFIININIKAE